MFAVLDRVCDDGINTNYPYNAIRQMTLQCRMDFVAGGATGNHFSISYVVDFFRGKQLFELNKERNNI